MNGRGDGLPAQLARFYNGRRVLVTGHTGFKGAWLTRMLTLLGAEVTGYALTPPTDPSLFTLSGLERDIRHIVGDVRDRAGLSAAFQSARPEVCFHLAAQPLVRESYRSPAYTFETNLMGTVNALDCARESGSVRSFLAVTTDKVYKNAERRTGYTERDELGGYDPYAASKACAELAVASYRSAFLADAGVSVSSVRAGNVIGGCDFARDRIVPDCVRAVESGQPILVRNPSSVRPYQHVLEPLGAYLLIACRQYENYALADCYNIGPDESGILTTGELATAFCEAWGDGAEWIARPDGGPHEAGLLTLNCTKVRDAFGWTPRLTAREAVRLTVAMEKARLFGGSVRAVMDAQITSYRELDR